MKLAKKLAYPRALRDGVRDTTILNLCTGVRHGRLPLRALRDEGFMRDTMNPDVDRRVFEHPAQSALVYAVHLIVAAG